jgi:Ion channel
MDREPRRAVELGNGRSRAEEASPPGLVGLADLSTRVVTYERDELASELRGIRKILHWHWRAPDNYGIVLAMIVLATLVEAATEGSPPARVVALILFGAALLYAMHTSRTAPELEGLAMLGVLAALALALVSIFITGRLGMALRFDNAVASTLVITTPFVIGRRLLQHTTVTSSTITGALCVYLLIGLGFASIFGLTEALGLGSFFAHRTASNDSDFLYFSFATLTTVGYGDLVARTNLGRMLSVTEALVGQAYLVTVIAVLVGNLGRRRRQERVDQGGRPVDDDPVL